MKKLIFFSCMALAVAGCSNRATKDETTATDSSGSAATAAAATTSEKLEYPYMLSKPYQNWQAGNQQNAITVMKGLKAFENGDIDACMASFGDSVELRFDYLHTKLSNDSLKKWFTKQRANYASLTVKMDDWEPVISSDKTEEWVTLWYKQIWTDKKGKTDSMSVINDAKIEKGKIVLLDEKTQHFPVVKK